MSDISDELLSYLGSFITENKRSKMERVLASRTRHVAVVLEDIYQPHNASACLRTCECLGVQDVHIIEERNSYTLNPEVAMGSSKWLSLYRYNRQDGRDNTEECIRDLRQRGYRIIATSPEREAPSARELDLERPFALLFGTEELGLSDRALSAADGFLRLPMYGFTQSYNISVSVAIALSTLVHRLHASEIPWRLANEDRRALTLEWYRKLIRRNDLFEERFRRELERIEAERSAKASGETSDPVADAEELRGQDRTDEADDPPADRDS